MQIKLPEFEKHCLTTWFPRHTQINIMMMTYYNKKAFHGKLKCYSATAKIH